MNDQLFPQSITLEEARKLFLKNKGLSLPNEVSGNMANTIFQGVSGGNFPNEINLDEARKLYEMYGHLPQYTPNTTVQSSSYYTIPANTQGLNPNIISLIRKAFGKDADMAIKIARAESGLNPGAEGDKNLTLGSNGLGHSFGLFQIRSLPGRPDPQWLLNPVNNINYAAQMFKKQGWNPWSTYKNGAYLKY